MEYVPLSAPGDPSRREQLLAELPESELWLRLLQPALQARAAGALEALAGQEIETPAGRARHYELRARLKELRAFLSDPQHYLSRGE